MKRIAAIFLTVLTVTASLCSCIEKEPRPCLDVLSAMTESEIDLPAGKIYSSIAEKGSDKYLPESLTSALFGNGSAPSLSSDWLDCALFLSLNEHPCEFAVIYCRNRDTALDTAKLLNSRIDAVKIQKGNEFPDILNQARVTVIGNYAVMAISTDSESAVSKAKNAIIE